MLNTTKNGVVGKAAHINNKILLQSAGDAQIRAGTSRPEWQCKTYEIVGYRTVLVNCPPYGDDPHDQEMIKIGFEYYNKTYK